jgi:predicted RNA binding protein YcfA (HicA-like mRNA interferase family)
MTGKLLLRAVLAVGCGEVRQSGSHVFVRCATGCTTVIPLHAGQDLGPGLKASIGRQLSPCLGDGWLQELERAGIKPFVRTRT